MLLARVGEMIYYALGAAMDALRAAMDALRAAMDYLRQRENRLYKGPILLEIIFFSLLSLIPDLFSNKTFQNPFFPC